MTAVRRWLSGGAALAAALLLALAGCSGTPKPKPTPLEPVAPQIGGRLVWSSKIDSVKYPLLVAVNQTPASGGIFTVAGGDGTVVALQAETGSELWRGNAGAQLSAGVGSDGRFAAVVTRDNELVTFDAGRIAWRARLASRVATAPLVAGERVFVMGVDRVVHAFDALDGGKLWTLQRPGEPLTLAKPGVLAAYRDTLLAGQGARLTGIDPTRGTLRWEVAVAAPRGTNEVERLADLIGPAVRVGHRLCARSFQAAVGCADADSGRLLWSRNAGGVNAVGGDDELIVGADATDRIVAWKTANGDLAWTSERMLFRGLSAPAALGPAVVFGDFEGYVHFLDRKDGQPLLRLATDGSQVVGKPVLSGTTLLVATRNGGLFAFRPE